MLNVIGGKQVLTSTVGAISIVRRLGADHCFLVIEGLNNEGKRVMKEAHLGWPTVRDAMGNVVLERGHPKKDKTRTQIYYFDVTLTQLQELGENCVYKTWPINVEQKKRLEAKIVQDTKLAAEGRIAYVMFGKTRTGGSSGASSDAVGAGDSKQASIEKNHSLLESKGSSASSVHESVNASLQRGHSCVSWARGAAEVTLGAIDATELLATPFFINRPTDLLPDPGPTTEKCVLM